MPRWEDPTKGPRPSQRAATHGYPFGFAKSQWLLRDRLLVRMVDAPHDTSDVGDDLAKELHAEFEDAQLLDLYLLTGWYHAISFVARGAGVELEAGAPRFVDYA